MKRKRRSVAIIVPAYNEEEVISTTLKSLKKVVPARDIYVVDDASKDKTAMLAKKITKNVHTVKKGGGKANALNTGISVFKLTEKYDYIMPVDADCVIDTHFFDNVIPLFQADKRKRIACVIGKVVGQNHKWVTTYRLWEYEITQTIHKSAQSIMNAVVVCPGPSTVFRSEVFKKVKIPNDTVTEDMDLTFIIHRKKLGKILFCPKALVYTQDPKTIADFTKQVDRWYRGFWQCVFKHNIPWGEQMLDLEVGFLASEGLFNGVLTIALIILVPLSIINGSTVFAVPLGLDIFFFMLPTFLYTAFRYRSWAIFKYIPQFYFMRLLTSLIFLRSFFKTIFLTQLSKYKRWNTKRYELREEEAWAHLSVHSAARRS